MRRLFLTLFILLPSLVMASIDYKEIDSIIAKNQLSQALTMIKNALMVTKKDIELLARKSRVIALLAEEKSDKEAKIKTYEQAQKIAQKIIEIDADSAKGYLRRAIANGKLALFKGILESRSLILSVRSDAKKVLELSSTSSYEKALANYLLGRVNIKLATKPKVLRIPLGLGWASNKKGGKFLKTAYELAPQSISFNLSYAQWLIENENKDKAKTILASIENLSVFDPADIEHKVTAKKLLSDL